MMTSREIKAFALESGADLVGVGDLAHFGGTPPERDPRHIAPRAKSIIGLGFRVLRGSLRGVEERTHYFQFPEMGIVHIDEVHAPTVLRRIACFLEDHGHEGVVQRTVPDRRRGDDPTTNPERAPVSRIAYARPVAAGRPAPDVLMDFNQAAVICGMGELGLGGFVLTPRFGPLQRFAFILTDAELEPDPPAPALCDQCGKCLSACPGRAIGTDGTLDTWQCAAYRMGADIAHNPFLVDELLADHPEAARLMASGKRFAETDVAVLRELLEQAYPPVRFGYASSLCGVACQCACLAHLEAKGSLSDTFAHPFRSPHA